MNIGSLPSLANTPDAPGCGSLTTSSAAQALGNELLRHRARSAVRQSFVVFGLLLRSGQCSTAH
jgi:hypothetical protein